MQKKILVLLTFIITTLSLLAQPDTSSIKNTFRKKVILSSGSGLLTVGSLLALNQAWYADYKTGKFHFFNDNKEWLQMDKAGHAFTNFQMARLMMGAFEWAGFTRKQQVLYGGSIGFAYMTAIECMDGFSKGWGFSWGDETANALGTGLAVSQRVLWNEQRVSLKFSYASSGLARYNPSLLGKNPQTQILKDYNGQTYWLTFSPLMFSKHHFLFPKWINLALGYGAYGMLGGRDNNIISLDKDGNAIKFDRIRHYYLSLDINLCGLKVKNKVLKRILSTVNILKIPFPTLEFSKNGVKFYYLYY